jgi:hypothetical protein
MNIDHAALPDIDLPSLNPNGDPAGDRAALGFGRDDADDPVWRKRRAALLERLVERGVEVAEELPALARAQSRLAEAVTECLRKATPEGRAALGELAVTLHQGNVDFALMYERISRSVRRGIAMREHTPPLRSRAATAPNGGGAARSQSRASGEPAAEAGRDPEVEAEKDMLAGRTGEVDAEDLFGDLYDRPEDPTGMADLGLDRPLAELVAEICADFGVDGKIWAERLGLDEEATEAPAAQGKRRPGGRRHRTERHTDRPPHTMPPSVPLAADDRGRPAPDNPVAGDPGRIADIGLGGRNRRERRAALKLARRSPHAANRRQPESGRGPP